MVSLFFLRLFLVDPDSALVVAAEDWSVAALSALFFLRLFFVAPDSVEVDWSEAAAASADFFLDLDFLLVEESAAAV